MTSHNRWEISTGIIALAAMTPAAVTSFPTLQKSLSERWRQIHLLTVPALILVVMHNGTHYLGKIDINAINLVRTYGIVFISVLVLLIRKKVFLSLLTESLNVPVEK